MCFRKNKQKGENGWRQVIFLQTLRPTVRNQKTEENCKYPKMTLKVSSHIGDYSSLEPCLKRATAWLHWDWANMQSPEPERGQRYSCKQATAKHSLVKARSTWYQTSKVLAASIFQTCAWKTRLFEAGAIHASQAPCQETPADSCSEHICVLLAMLKTQGAIDTS